MALAGGVERDAVLTGPMGNIKEVGAGARQGAGHAGGDALSRGLVPSALEPSDTGRARGVTGRLLLLLQALGAVLCSAAGKASGGHCRKDPAKWPSTPHCPAQGPGRPLGQGHALCATSGLWPLLGSIQGTEPGPGLRSGTTCAPVFTRMRSSRAAGPGVPGSSVLGPPPQCPQCPAALWEEAWWGFAVLEDPRAGLLNLLEASGGQQGQGPSLEAWIPGELQYWLKAQPRPGSPGAREPRPSPAHALDLSQGSPRMDAAQVHTLRVFPEAPGLAQPLVSIFQLRDADVNAHVAHIYHLLQQGSFKEAAILGTELKPQPELHIEKDQLSLVKRYMTDLPDLQRQLLTLMDYWCQAGFDIRDIVRRPEDFRPSLDGRSGLRTPAPSLLGRGVWLFQAQAAAPTELSLSKTAACRCGHYMPSTQTPQTGAQEQEERDHQSCEVSGPGQVGSVRTPILTGHRVVAEQGAILWHLRVPEGSMGIVCVPGCP
ncbi:PREDICTED: exonuclease mut-7 homolog [Chinchilla lanigera]|uniref:exonuclease mut-7 homolog n=1 Tax=Chinchilla lanigera TaxID=34839 RepID=UPI000698BCD8|nr:PREDICTED: exonuclease mut-7 homolog [Chinchilla lanigera]